MRGAAHCGAAAAAAPTCAHAAAPRAAPALAAQNALEPRHASTAERKPNRCSNKPRRCCAKNDDAARRTSARSNSPVPEQENKQHKIREALVWS